MIPAKTQLCSVFCTLMATLAAPRGLLAQTTPRAGAVGRAATMPSLTVEPPADAVAVEFAPENAYRNWPLANNRMAEVLKAKGYEYQYLWAEQAGHVERGVERQTLTEAMAWVWKTYKPR